MSKSARNAVIAALLLIVLVACAWFAHGRVHFDWVNLKLQMRALNWISVVIALVLLNLSIATRAPRWNLLLGKSATTSASKITAPQYVGFTVVALFGRVADLARPYLIARRTNTPVATQLAVYSIERGFDLAAAAILFSVTLVFSSHTAPHHEVFKKAGEVALAGTLFIVVFAVMVRFAGAAVAGLARTIFRIISAEFAESAATKILDFREGLRTIATATQFFGALAWSLLNWSLIASAYYYSAHAFRDCPQLAAFTIPSTMLLMATSMGGSLLQLPIVGWFTQIGVLAGAYNKFFDVPVEVAAAAGAIAMLVTTLGVVPIGLIAARIEGIGLRDAAHSGEALEAKDTSSNS